jgi:hypothetical protein
MEQHAFKNVNNCLNTNIYSYSETSGGLSSHLYLNVHFFNTSLPVLIRHLWQLKTVVFLHWCLIRAIPLRRLNMFAMVKHIFKFITVRDTERVYNFYAQVS